MCRKACTTNSSPGRAAARVAPVSGRSFLRLLNNAAAKTALRGSRLRAARQAQEKAGRRTLVEVTAPCVSMPGDPATVPSLACVARIAA